MDISTIKNIARGVGAAIVAGALFLGTRKCIKETLNPDASKKKQKPIIPEKDINSDEIAIDEA